MEDNDNNEVKEPSKVKEAAGAVAKSFWKRLPLRHKLYVIAGVAAVVFGLLLIVLIIGAIPTLFLDYSNAVEKSKDVPSEYEEFWADFCEEDSDACSEEQKKAFKELQESQTKFFNKLDSLAKKYDLSKKQKYLVLTTIFYGLDINEFTEGNNAFEIDSTDEINYEVDTSSNVYKREQDSLKELIKQFKVNTAFCTYDRKLENGEMETGKQILLYDDNNNTFSFNFFDKFKYSVGFTPDDEAFKRAKATCEAMENGKVTLEETTDSEASINGFYKYLKESTYFDDKPHLRGEFIDYGRAHGLSTDITTWAEEERQIVRESIIRNIKDIVDSYVEEEGPEFVAATGRAYWWPIGSAVTTEENGVIFASGPPQYTGVNDDFGDRVHPITGKYNFHNGVDLQGAALTNVIASLGGTVLTVNNSCASYNSNGCGGGYGNYIEIQDTKGNINLYAHLYKDTITVSKNDTVAQGQVIGKVGSSGNSTGPHLHFMIKVNGEAKDPLEYIDANNPRPLSYSTTDFNKSSYTREEFIARLNTYYSTNTSCTSAGCASFKSQILNHDGAGIIYDVATSKNINPEIVVARSILEGYSPGTSYNYFGYRCYNTGGLAACSKFTSFKSGMETFFNNISQYDSLESMMSRYAYLGDYWYTGVHWGWGGCAYAPYIYPDGVPDRVSNACSKPDGTCTTTYTSECVPTNEDDHAAYARWQVLKMDAVLSGVFG